MALRRSVSNNFKISFITVVPESPQLSVKIKLLLKGKDVCVTEQHGTSYDDERVSQLLRCQGSSDVMNVAQDKLLF
ncbi:hypothetical protein PS15p_203151 [Mucor circinelloides]